MKKITKIFLLVVILITAISLSASATNVSGGIYSNTTWTLANSPYIVVGAVVVFPAVTLTIEPGVIVKFADSTYLEIRQANLIAIGNATDSITFTSNSILPTPGIWQYIFLNNSSVSKFNYCNVQYAHMGIFNDQTGSVNDSLIVRNSNFNFNHYGVFSELIDGTNEFDSCNFINNQDGFAYDFTNTQIMANFCNFSFNLNNGYGGFGGNGYLNNCIISNNQNIGIRAARSLKNSIIFNNQTGIEFLSSINNSVVRDNIYGILDGDSVDNCIIKNNQYGVNASNIMNSIIDSNSVYGVYLRANVINCEIKYNAVGLYLIDSVYTITKNVIESNTIGIEMLASNNIFCNRICSNTSYDLKYEMSTNYTIMNNYWCTADSASTSAVIYDGYDDINFGLVNFMPLDTLQCYLSATGIDESVSNIESVSVFPNPFSDNLTLLLPTRNSKTKIRIVNLLGQTEFSSTVETQKSNIDVSSLAKGLYMLEITTEHKTVNKKIIKQ